MSSKALYFVGASLDELRDFPNDARREAGHQLHLLQLGETPSDWKPMSSVGPGVFEIRIHTTLERRVLCVSRHAEGVYVLHALRLRSALMATIVRLIDVRSLTQAKAASLFGVSQPRISDLVRGKIDLFSIDTLVEMLARADVRVELRIPRVA